MVSGNFNLFTLFGGDTFVKPQWARLECAPTDSYEGLENVFIPKSGSSVFCGANEFTDECRVKVLFQTRFGGFNPMVNYKICDNEGSSCSSLITNSNFPSGSGSISLEMTNLLKGKKYFMYCSDILGSKDCNVEKTYKPWKLFRFVGGAKFEARDQDCNIDSSLKSNLLSEDAGTLKLGMSGGEGTKWINYVSDWVYGPASNIVVYSGQEAYCQAPNLYTITTIAAADGSKKKVDPNYVGTREDGQTIRGLGSIIRGDIECCYGLESNCGPDFKFSGVPGGNSCTTDLQCFNAGGPVPKTSTSYTLFQCVSSQCKESNPINVECTTNSACPSGKICDLSRGNYGKCIQQSGTGCGNNVCESGENVATCTTDCKPKTGECNGFKITHESNPNFIQKLFGAQDSTTETCVASSFIIIIVIGLIILALVFGLISRRKR